MLNQLIEVGELMIRARIAEAIGEEDEAHECYLDASLSVQCHAYAKAMSDCDYQEPMYLKFYPNFLKDWEYGFQHGLDYLEIKRCDQCQDPEIEMCSHHDR